jgi:hypothetical protein
MVNTSFDSLQYKRSASSISDKLERTFAIQQELIDALKRHGCPNCLQLLREIVKKYGDSSLATTNLQVSTRDGLIDTFDIRRT